MRYLIAVWLVACANARGGGENGGEVDAAPAPCVDGAQRCQDGAFEVCVGGRFEVAEACAQACADSLGCVACVPGTTTCDGEAAGLCRPDGSGYDPFHCDPLQGLSCNVDSAICEGPCAPQHLGKSYVGCEYYPTVTGNEVRSEFEFAVVVSNDRAEPASVHVEGGALAAPITFEVGPRSVHAQRLPWVEELKACEAYGVLECGNPQGSTALARGGAYHLRSTVPVTVYQYNPLDYQLADAPCAEGVLEGCSYSNDASLMIPVTAMTGRYYVASYANWSSRTGASFPGFMTITATEDGTTVTVNAAADAYGAVDLPWLTKGSPVSFVLDAGDVAQYFAVAGSDFVSVDLTGTRVDADKPIQVIGGHYCTETIGMACDHMEESMLPVEALGTRYLVSAPEAGWQRDFWGEEFHVGERYLKIVATEPGTEITYDPPDFRLAPGQTAPTYLANAGDVGTIVYAYFRDSVEIRSNKKILVAEYMMGGQQAGIGDPAMAVAVPVEQYRTNYSFHAPTNYDLSYVNVIAPDGVEIFLDGATTPLLGFEPVGQTGYGALRVLLDGTGSGTHWLESAEPFGITVYGYGAYTSYWYAGGLDLEPIVVE
jgi:hypothetical protein